MPFYHVLVKLKGDPNKVRCIFSDLSLRELEKKFLKPYRYGQGTMSGAEVIETSAVTWTKIIQTARSCAVELKDIQAKSYKEIDEFNRSSNSIVLISIGRGYDAEDITEAGEDVTARFVTAPPGKGVGALISTFNHQWVVAILGGLIVAGVAAWLGWA